MNGLDLVIVLLAALAAVVGWRLGFLTRALGWIGAGAGLVVAILAVPRLMELLDLSSETVVLLMGTAAIVLVVTIGQAIGASLGARLRPPVRSRGARTLDAVGGGALGVLGVLVLVWLVAPVMAQTDGWAAAAARRSALARFTSENLPEPPASLAELEAQLASGDFPQLFEGLAPAPDIGPPPADSPIGAEQLTALAASTVRVEGRACDTIQSGSGFVVAPGLVVTNAHVVAGTRASQLTAPDGATADGRVVAFDPRVDLAVVATDLDRPVLPLAEPGVSDQGLVLGFPGGGPFDPSPFQVGELVQARGYDIYDEDLVDRDLAVLSSELEPGDSGSAVVRADGSVIGVAVAVAPDKQGVAYALQTAEVRRLLEDPPGAEAVDTGPCLD